MLYQAGKEVTILFMAPPCSSCGRMPSHTLIHPVHYLLDHTCFSIFDLLWVRDFNVEITVETNYDTYSEYSEYDDLDWTKCDYL